MSRDNNIDAAYKLVIAGEASDELQLLLTEREELEVLVAELEAAKQAAIQACIEPNARIGEIDAQIYSMLPPNPLGTMSIGV